MTRFHLFLDNIKSVPVYLLKLNGHLELWWHPELRQPHRRRQPQGAGVALLGRVHCSMLQPLDEGWSVCTGEVITVLVINFSVPHEYISCGWHVGRYVRHLWSIWSTPVLTVCSCHKSWKLQCSKHMYGHRRCEHDTAKRFYLTILSLKLQLSLLLLL